MNQEEDHPASLPEKILVTGASGLLGSNLFHHFARKAECIGLYFMNPVNISGTPLEHLDLTRHSQVSRMVERFKPTLIIHCAAITDLEWYENNPDLAHALNVDATLFLA